MAIVTLIPLFNMITLGLQILQATAKSNNLQLSQAVAPMLI